MEEIQDLEMLEQEFEKQNYSAILKWTIKFGKYKGYTYETLFNEFDWYVDFLINKDILKNEKVIKCYNLRKQIKQQEIKTV